MTERNWSDDEIVTLRQLWTQDDPQLSTAEIGRRMRRSKDSVVGKAGRVGLPGRPSPIERRTEWVYSERRKGKAPAPKVTLPPVGFPAAASPEPRAAPIRSIEPAPVRPTPTVRAIRSARTCQFIVCDRPLRFCGAEVEARSLCADHFGRCYSKSRPVNAGAEA
jgi:hypothetical protein